MRTESIYITRSEGGGLPDAGIESRLSERFDHFGHCAAKGKKSLLSAMQTAAGRSNAMFIIGGFAGDEVDITPVIADSLGTGISGFEMNLGRSGHEVLLPTGIRPIYNSGGILSGGVISSGDGDGAQHIVLLGGQAFSAMETLDVVLTLPAFMPDALDIPDVSDASVEAPQPEPEPEMAMAAAIAVPDIVAANPVAPAEPAMDAFSLDNLVITDDAEYEPEADDGDGDYGESEPNDIALITERESSIPLGRILISAVSVVLAAAIIIAGAFHINTNILIPRTADRLYNELRGLIGKESEGIVPFDLQSKFGALYDMNKNFAAWVKVPGTNIDYPVVCSSTQNYSDALYNGKRNVYGTPYINELISVDKVPKHLSVFGNDIEGSMFSELNKYKNINFYKANPVLSFDYYFKDNDCAVFSMFPANNYLDFTTAGESSEEYMSSLVSSLYDCSVINTGVQVETGDSIVILVSVSAVKGDNSCFVVAGLLGDGFEINTSAATLNSSAEVWKSIKTNEDDTSSFFPSDAESYESYEPGVDENGSMITMAAPHDAVLDSLGDSSPLFHLSSMISDMITGLNKTVSPGTASAASGDGKSGLASGGSSAGGTASGGASSKLSPSITPSTPGKASSVPLIPAASSAAASSGSASFSEGTNINEGTSYPPIIRLDSKITSLDVSGTVPLGNWTTVIRVKNNYVSGSPMEEGSIGEMVARNVQPEMGWEYASAEALKAQALAAYSYMVYYYNVYHKAPTLPFCDSSKVTAKTRSAVNAVTGQYVTYGGKIALTIYGSISAGKTIDAYDLWGAVYPYMVSVDSSVDLEAPGYKSTRKYSCANVKMWVKDQYGIELSGDPMSWFKIEYDKNGLYAVWVTIGGSKKVRGAELRDKLFTSSRVGSSNTLRSNSNFISYDAGTDSLVIDVYGYGHGTGMSQAGAVIYDNKYKWNYKQILTHYYKGVSIVG